MARALVTKLRIPDTAAQTRKSPVARSGRAEASCHDISNTWLAHGYSSSSLTTPATQSALCGSYTAPQKMHDILTRLAKCRVDTRPGQRGASNLQGGNHTYPYSETIRDLPVRCAQGAGVRISKAWKTQVIPPPPPSPN